MQCADRVRALRHAGNNDGRDLSQHTGRQRAMTVSTPELHGLPPFRMDGRTESAHDFVG
jgi:hypothetical protein